MNTSTTEVMDTICNLKSLCLLIEKHVKDAGDDQVLEEPIWIGKVASLELWNEYTEYDKPPLHPKYLFFLDDTLDIFIVELPMHIHEFFSSEIFALQRDQCRFLQSVCSQADQFIAPSYTTPGFGGLPMNTLWFNYSTFII
jgi:hypothetical protein